MGRGSVGFRSGPVSSQLEMVRRPLQCGSDMQEEEVRDVSWRKCGPELLTDLGWDGENRVTGKVRLLRTSGRGGKMEIQFRM